MKLIKCPKIQIQKNSENLLDNSRRDPTFYERQNYRTHTHTHTRARTHTQIHTQNKATTTTQYTSAAISFVLL